MWRHSFASPFPTVQKANWSVLQGLTYFHGLHAAHTVHLALSVCLQRRAGRFWNSALGMERLLDATCVSPGCGVPAYRVWGFGESPGKPWSGICHFANKGQMRIAGTGLLAVLSLHNVTTQETRTGRQDKRHGFTCITDFQIEHRCTLHIRIFYCSNLYPTRCNVTQLILSGNCSTCFGWYHHPSSGAQTTVSTASGICQTVTATCCYSGR